MLSYWLRRLVCFLKPSRISGQASFKQTVNTVFQSCQSHLLHNSTSVKLDQWALNYMKSTLLPGPTKHSHIIKLRLSSLQYHNCLLASRPSLRLRGVAETQILPSSTTAFQPHDKTTNVAGMKNRLSMSRRPVSGQTGLALLSPQHDLRQICSPDCWEGTEAGLAV